VSVLLESSAPNGLAPGKQATSQTIQNERNFRIWLVIPSLMVFVPVHKISMFRKLALVLALATSAYQRRGQEFIKDFDRMVAM